MRIVQKYGGTSLADAVRIFSAAGRIQALHQRGVQVVAVVSAQGDTTDDLLQTSQAINPDGGKRELDAYMAVGEQLSAGLMAMALQKLGCPAISLCGWQAGILTDDRHQNARILELGNSRILEELERGNAVVVAGFQGVCAAGDITTLGRGGSDTTAAALAAFLQADLCQIFTDVEGVYEQDPRVYPNARKFEKISYERMLELIRGGAQVLHDRSVEIARDYGITLEVLSAFTGAPGTQVGPWKDCTLI